MGMGIGTPDNISIAFCRRTAHKEHVGAIRKARYLIITRMLVVERLLLKFLRLAHCSRIRRLFFLSCRHRFETTAILALWSAAN
jgi:hypothetical protein